MLLPVQRVRHRRVLDWDCDLVCLFLGAALQLTNAYGDVFLDEFKLFPVFAESFVIKYSTIILSISQVSEALFILAIPFFLKRFGIKWVIAIPC